MDYLINFGVLLFSLTGIVFSAIIFTNGIEHVGKKFGISDGATGSIFAAIATALPETLVPVIAIYGIIGISDELIFNHPSYNVAIGAMLGAPLMLSTITIALMSLFAGKSRGWNVRVNPESKFTLRDLKIFLLGSLGIMVLALFENRLIEISVGALLILTYCFYLYKTLTDEHDSEDEGDLETLWLSRVMNDCKLTAIIQSLLSVLFIFLFAKGLIQGIESLSEIITKDINDGHAKAILIFVLSAILVPIATELPEKINSIIWIKKGKDNLAIGNITGALAFQATVIPAIITFMAPVSINITAVNGFSVIVTIASAITFVYFIKNEKLTPKTGLLFVLPYLAFILFSFFVK